MSATAFRSVVAHVLVYAKSSRVSTNMNVSFKRHERVLGRRFHSTGTVNEHQMRGLLQRYIDGSVMEPHEKHVVRTELLKNEMRMHPSHAATLLYTHMEGYQDIAEPIIKRLEENLHCIWGETTVPDDAVAKALECHDQDASRRKDFTGMETITIDDETTTEIDDGLSAVRVDAGTVLVSIHIADPTRWLPNPTVPLALMARTQSHTVYLPHTKIPMLPVSLGVERCSLREGIETPALTMSCLLRISDGSIVENSIEITPSVIKTDSKLSYSRADQCLEDHGPMSREGNMLYVLQTAAESRFHRRRMNGAFTLHPTPELTMRASLSSPCRIEHVAMIDLGVSKSRQLVAEMMILAGEMFGQLGGQRGIPLPYRGQEIPILPTDQDLAQYPEGPCRNYYRRKYMLKSIVDANAPHRHQSLGIDQYVQATSPIRRFTDMLAHWQMKAVLRGDGPVYTSKELQDSIDDVAGRSKKMHEIERKIEDTWLCVYFSKHQNEPLQSILLHWLNQDHSLAIVRISCIGKEVVATIHHPVALGNTVILYCTYSDPLTQTLSFSSLPYTT